MSVLWNHRARRAWLAGLAAGALATAPMTAVMVASHEIVTPEEPLPPREVAMGVASKTGLKDELDHNERSWFVWLSHFGYGSTVGSLYTFIDGRVPPLVGGAAYGLAVWAAGYLGYLPALGVVRPPGQYPAGRHASAILAHLVWGTTLALALSATGGTEAEEWQS